MGVYSCKMERSPSKYGHLDYIEEGMKHIWRIFIIIEILAFVIGTYWLANKFGYYRGFNEAYNLSDSIVVKQRKLINTQDRDLKEQDSLISEYRIEILTLMKDGFKRN